MTENAILLLIKMITVLYYENKSLEKNNYVVEEVQQLLANIKVENTNTGLGSEDEAIAALRSTVEWMMCNMDTVVDEETHERLKFSRENIIQRMVINLHCDNEYIEVAKKYLNPDITPEEAKSRVLEILSELRFSKRQNKLKLAIQTANKKLNFSGDYVEPTAYINNLITELEALNTKNKGEAPGLIGKVDFMRRKEIENILKKTADAYSAKGILNTGFQGLNRMTGVGGLRRGELVNFGATTHNYKSGILIDLALNVPFYNIPWLMDETKKPMILRISFENTLEQDLGIMYKKLWEMEHQEECNLAEINTAKASKYLVEYFATNGYHFHMESYDPNTFNIYDLYDVLNSYINQGYEIHLVSCDYLPLIAHNTLGDRLDTKIQKTYEMVRNFCFPKGITFATGCQLSTEAQNEQRNNTTTFTRKVCTGGWYMDCKSLHTKLDLEIVMGVHNHVDGCRYLYFSRGKHRGGETTPLPHCHFIRMFERFGGIVPDVKTDDKSMSKLPNSMLELDAVW